MIGLSLGVWQLRGAGEYIPPEPALLAVSISGLLQVGQVLTAVVTDAGEGALSYVWERDGTPIAGATAQTYEAVAADDGAILSVVVTKVGVAVPMEGTAAEAITYPAPTLTGTPISDISITEGDGGGTVATAAAFAGDDLTFSAQLLGGAALPDGWSINTGTGVFTYDDDPQSLVTVEVGASNSGGMVQTTFTVEVGDIAVTPAINSVTVTGVLKVGETLTATVDHTGTGALSYSVERDNVVIAGPSTDNTYTAVPLDDGTTISFVVAKVGVASPVEEVAGVITYYAPTLSGEPIPDINALTSGGGGTIDASVAFLGDDITYTAEISGGGALPVGWSIDSATGIFTYDDDVQSAIVIAVTATNSGGAVSSTFDAEVQSPIPAPSYDGGMTTQSAVNNVADQTYDVTPFFSNTSGGTWSIVVTPATASITINASTGLLTYRPLPLPEGSWSVAVTVDVAGQTATGSVTIEVTAAGAVTLEPLDYDGLMDTSLVQADLPYNFSQHISGPGTITYGATSLPGGVSINTSTGVISGTIGGAATATITATNGEPPIVSVSTGFSTAAPAAPTYDGLAPATIAPGHLPYNFSVHITGTGVTYSATGLPAGVTINSTSGVISDSGTFTGTSSATITATNGTSPDAVASISFSDAAAPTAFVESTDFAFETNSATLSIGTDEPGRVIYVSVMVGATEDSALSVTGGTVTKLATDSAFAGRACDIYSVTGLTGTTAAMSWGGDQESVAVFKVIGYQPIAADFWKLNRRTGNDILTHNIVATVPVDGCILLHGKKYDGFSVSPTGTVIDEATGGLRGYWVNDTGLAESKTWTFNISSSANEKYCAGLIMELI